MWLWISCNASSIQAVAAVYIVALTAITLTVLYRYAADTKSIAESSVEQLENAQMPCVDAVQNDIPPHSGWQFRNQGFGPALNLRCSFIEGRHISSLAPRDVFVVQNEFPSVVADRVEANIQYQSLSGLDYRTLISWEGAEMKTQFKRPEPKSRKKSAAVNARQSATPPPRAQ